MEQLHLIRLQRVSYPAPSQNLREAQTSGNTTVGENFKEMQNYSAISGATTELLWSQGIIWPREEDSKELKLKKQSSGDKNISTGKD